MQSTPESGPRAGYDGAKRRKGTKVHAAVDTLGLLLALHVTPADEQDRAQVAELAQAVQQVTGETVELAYVDQGYTGQSPAAAAQAHGIQLEVVKLSTAKHGFVLLPRRWVVERSFAWMARFRRLARDYERLATTLEGFHYVAFALLALHVTPADEGDRAQVAELAAAVQEATGQRVEVAFVDQGYTGARAEADAAAHGIRLEVVKHPAAKRGFVLLPRRWVVERDFAWMARFRRLARDYERLATTLEGFHYVAFALLALAKAMPVLTVV